MGSGVCYGDGVYRRRIRLVARDDRVRGDLEDDFHRFGVEIRHDGHRILEARGDARRFPWETCAGATAQIEALEGTPLVERAADLAAHSDPRLHCTHLYDVAALVVAHAAAGRAQRQYDVAVPDRVDWRTEPSLERDGAPLLHWKLERHSLTGPAPFAGVSLRGRAFLDWIHDRLEPDLAEAALVLRRACYIAMGRATDLDTIPSADRVTPIAGATCHSMQPAIAPRALRVHGSTRQFSDGPERLLADAT